MSSSEDQISRKGAIATRIITRAQQRNHRARSDYIEARQLSPDVPWSIHHELQAAVMEFYMALKPLREHTSVEEFWEEAEICQIQDGWEAVKKNGEVVNYRPKMQTMTGFDRLESLTNQPTDEVKEIEDCFGKREIHTQSRELVDGHVLLNASQKLDDAANKLGFGPDIDESTPRTEIDDELLKEVEEWRQKNQ
ncbi:hypothetical protein OB905_13135 [Halobacteria archaeon AArc-dxtr1]|nr:hypothetical protein [Halobacteria archaeon AArc-dxtr1]